MEGFLYTLSAACIAVLATIAYKHPNSYKSYFAPPLSNICYILTLCALGYSIGTTMAREHAARAAIEILKSKQVDIFNDITQSIDSGNVTPLMWLALIAIMSYIRFLVYLPAIGLTADQQVSQKSS